MKSRDFKFTRLTALNYVLTSFERADPEARAWPESLTLGAWIIHCVNALHRRPDDNAQSLRLLDVITYHVEAEVEDSAEEELAEEVLTEPVGYSQGLFFAADIDIDDMAWRILRTVRFKRFAKEDLAYFYGRHNVETVKLLLKGRAAKAKRKVHPQRVANRVPQTDAVEMLHPQVADAEVVPDFDLHATGVEVTPRVAITGVDADIEGADVDACHPDILMQLIWRQVPLDVIKTSPNRKSATESPHTLLSIDERDSVTWALFESLDLSNVFPHAWVFKLNGADWGKLCDIYFPPKDSEPLHPKAQNWPSMTYLTRWKDLMSRVSVEDSKRIRQEVRVNFNKLKWLPMAKPDRVWQTKKVTTKKGQFYPLNEPSGPAPHIAINQAMVGGDAIIMGEQPAAPEDEEGDQEE